MRRLGTIRVCNSHNYGMGFIKVISLERDYISTQFVSFILDHNYVPRLNPIPKATVVSNELLASPNLNNEGGKASCHDNGTKFTCAYNGFRLSVC